MSGTLLSDQQGEKVTPSQNPAGATRAILSPAVRAAVDRVIARLMRPELPVDEKGLMTPISPESTYQSESQMLALLRLMQAQVEFAGRKLLFYIGHGLRVDAQFKELPRAIVGAANRAGVTLCGVDLNPMSGSELAESQRLLGSAVRASNAERTAKSDEPVTRDRVLAMETAEQSLHADTTMNLENLAKETGGEFIGRTNDLRTPMRRAMEDEMHRAMKRIVDGDAVNGACFGL